MDDTITCVLFLVCLLLSAFFSSAETAFFALSPLRLKKLEDEGDTRASEILKVLADKQKMLITLLMGNTLVNVAATAIVTTFFIAYLPETRLKELLVVGPTVSVITAALYPYL